MKPNKKPNDDVCALPANHADKGKPMAFAPENSLPHAFSVVANRVSATLERMYSQSFGLSVVGWRVIAMLGARAPLSARALSELTAMDQVSISRAVDQLVDARYVLRRVDMADRRRVALQLSKRGREVYDQVVPVLEACENCLMHGLSKADAQTLRRVIGIIVERTSSELGKDSDWQSVLQKYATTD